MGWVKDRKSLDSLQLSRCIDDRATDSEVEESLKQGKEMTVDGTPTLFVNGRRINPRDLEDLKRYIDAELAYQAVAKDAGENCNCDTKLDVPGQTPKKTPAVAVPKKK